MSTRTRVRLAAVLCLWFAILAGCSRRQAQVPAQPAVPPNVVILLADPDGSAGRLAVSNQAGSQDLSQAYTAVRIANRATAPTSPAAISQQEIDALVGSVLTMLPEPESTFVFYFRTGTDDLTPESDAQVPLLLQTIARKASTDISITGHTDTTGASDSNYELALRRAQRLANILLQRGLPRDHLTVESHGEANLLVPTADNVAEPRNRRVEVIVR